MVDALVLGTSEATHGGSSPLLGIFVVLEIRTTKISHLSRNEYSVPPKEK